MLLAILFVMALTADTRIASAATGGAGQGVPAGGLPFDRHGMWIWYVDRSEGGSIGRILARVKAAGIGTLYIRAGDADDISPSQFNKTLVGALRRGADCLVIDAEGQHEGRYAAADRCIRALRSRIGEGAIAKIVRFRRFAESYGGLAPSWWDWQETSSSGWDALGQGLPVDGAIGTDTWRSLLNFDPVRPRWAGRRAKRGGAVAASRALPPRRPLSASLPAKAYEIEPGPAP